ncbi:diacylglycerol kinase family protein [Runella salmonicolor]|uniref:Diacylglycerol kinase family protein n=1 Tax=Runella salmonicolor TaxID=2950278 RepID=A0ABT1FZ66_9BACT|nr:diacylglycerol kinase family protein [Runella salmonicolor]MCP1385998.1 diacylglycerol kinase family protein [Runella salmonicolor]
MINVRKMLRSFGYAVEGVVALFRYENNARFHLLAALVVVIAGIIIGLTYLDWVIIVIVIGGVWAAEAFNTAIEKLCDVVSPGIHPQIKAIKDLAAAGVLIMAGTAALTGVIIFGKAIITSFSFTF